MILQIQIYVSCFCRVVLFFSFFEKFRSTMATNETSYQQEFLFDVFLSLFTRYKLIRV